jgi:hypothetical protein
MSLLPLALAIMGIPVGSTTGPIASPHWPSTSELCCWESSAVGTAPGAPAAALAFAAAASASLCYQLSHTTNEENQKYARKTA